MRAAFRACRDIKNNPKSRVKSIIAVLGDMNELGESSEALHQEVARDCREFAQILTCGRFSKDWKSGAPDKTIIFKSKNDIIDYIRSQKAEDTLYLIKASHGARFDEIASGLT
jgi:UDP-N-acetylmuramyl pentapeptide synthase